MARTPADIPLVHTLYAAYAAWHDILLKFPKAERYSLGETISRRLLETIELILGAASTADAAEKLKHLREASAKLDTLKLLVRLAKDCRCLPNQHYLDMESRLHEAGKMIGGWLKSIG